MVVEVQSCWPPHLPKCQASPKAQDSRPRTARSLNGAFGHANQSNSAVRVLVPVQQTWLSPRCEMMFLAILLQVLGGIHWGRDTIEAVWVSEGICSSTKHQSPHLGIDAATHLFTSVSFRHFSFGSRQPGSRLFQSTGRFHWRPTTEYTPPAKGNTGRKWICAGYGNFLWIFLTNWGPSPLKPHLCAFCRHRLCVSQLKPIAYGVPFCWASWLGSRSLRQSHHASDERSRGRKLNRLPVSPVISLTASFAITNIIRKLLGAYFSWLFCGACFFNEPWKKHDHNQDLPGNRYP